MDCEKLISLVQERRSLWDPQERCYHNRDINRSLWNEVAESMNLTSSAVKTEWQRLRDTHRREVRKTNLPTGSQSQGGSTWRYFYQMSFLEDTYASRRMEGNIPDCTQNTRGDSDSDAGDNVEVIETHDTSAPRKRKRLAGDLHDDFLQIEKVKMNHLQQIADLKKDKHDKEDEHYFFLMSLHPHMRSMPSHKVLEARMRMQQVLMEVIESSRNNFDSTYILDSSLSQ